MKLYNNTANEAYYSISYPGAGDCGTIAAGDTLDMPFYDNQTDVNVTFTAVPAPSPFDVTINNTETGKVVTVGLYFE